MMEVLLADDDKVMRLYFTKFLEKEGFEVTACENGTDAWKTAKSRYFPLVLLDWNMPGMPGIEVCERIKQIEGAGFIYVILITSRSDTEDIVLGLKHGADDYITKPVVAAELNARLKSALRVINFEKQLREKEKQVRLSCYKTLTQLAETRDHESDNHMLRVGELSAMIAKEMGQDEEFCNKIQIFAPMHDIGKVGIPDGILNAPRSLNIEEFELIKMHTQIGWQILKSKQNFEFASRIAYTHHEHWDGTGYPRQLKGETIPLEGRICAVADTYDSLRSIKSYRQSLNHEEAMEKLKQDSGTVFDPRVVEAAVRIQSQMKTTFDRTFETKVAYSAFTNENLTEKKMQSRN